MRITDFDVMSIGCAHWKELDALASSIGAGFRALDLNEPNSEARIRLQLNAHYNPHALTIRLE
jgi:hypothetical protein